MKGLLKKYWYIPTIIISLILIIILPIGINKILLKPAPYEVVGTSETWLAFWSTYLGTIIGSLITLIVLFMTLKQNEANNKESKELQINIYKKGLEERRIQELRQAFKESLHFINHSQIHYNQRLIMTRNYIEASKFFISETARCKQTISTLSLDLIPVSKGEKLDEYQETYTDLLELYLILSIQIMNITSILIGQSFAEKKNLFHITITFNTSITVFSRSEIDDINRTKSEDQFVRQLTAIIQKHISEFSTKANNIEKQLMRQSVAIIDDLVKKLSAI